MGIGRTAAVAPRVSTHCASFEPNPWGVYQVHGNVWEWTEDCWHKNYQNTPADGSAWTTACTDGSSKVVHGGAWLSNPRRLRSADRGGYVAYSTEGPINGRGFRLART
jgi:formylglycine-generating enzyme required for sulfatase activity